MKKITDCATVHEFWEALSRSVPESMPFKPVHGSVNQERLEVGSEVIRARLVRRPYIGITCLRVSVAQPNTQQRAVTKLDFTRHFVDARFKEEAQGHLVPPTLPGKRRHGLHLANLSQVPDEVHDIVKPALETLDRGIQLLTPVIMEKVVDLWMVGPTLNSTHE